MSNKNSSGLISCRCTNCGGPLEIKKGQEYVTCAYCDTVFRIENASNNDWSGDIQLDRGTYYENPEKQQDIKSARKLGESDTGIQNSVDFAEMVHDSNRKDAKERAVYMELQRQRATEEAEAARKRSPGYIIGHFFLWSLFYPAMLISVILKRASERKENKELMANGFPPRKVTEFPIFYMIVCVFFFLSGWGNAITERAGDYSSKNSHTPFVTSVPTTTPVVTPDIKWYEKDIINMKNVTFSEETAVYTYNNFQYEIPISWRSKENDNMRYYYPFADTTKTFVGMNVDNYSDLDSNSFDLMKTDELNTSVLDECYRGMLRSDYFFDCEAAPCVLKDCRGMVISGEYKNDEANVKGTMIFTVLCKGNQMVTVSVLRANDEVNTSIDDYLAILNSIQFID